MLSAKLTISQFAKQGGVSVETVRFYHRRGLLPVPKPGKTAFREYEQNHLQQLHFIRKAQLAGFTLDEIKTLLQLDPIHERLQIQTLAKKQLDKLQVQIAELQQVAKSLHHLVHACEQSEEGTHCPIAKAFVNQLSI